MNLRYDSEKYRANGLLLQAALVDGDVAAALAACLELVSFLRATLSHVRTIDQTHVKLRTRAFCVPVAWRKIHRL